MAGRAGRAGPRVGPRGRQPPRGPATALQIESHVRPRCPGQPGPHFATPATAGKGRPPACESLCREALPVPRFLAGSSGTRRGDLRGCDRGTGPPQRAAQPSPSRPPRDVVDVAQQVLLGLGQTANMIEQVRRGRGGGNSRRHVGQVAALTLGQAKRLQPGPDLGRIQLVAQSHPNHVDQVCIVLGGRLPQGQQGLDVGQVRVRPSAAAAARRTKASCPRSSRIAS